jgi:hypothetical protein
MNLARIEGYLFVPYRGQHRFSFSVSHGAPETIFISDIEKSDPQYDYYWDASMRTRPTLAELVDLDNGLDEVWKEVVIHKFRELAEKLLHNPGAPFIGDVAQPGYATGKAWKSSVATASFVNVPQ